MERGEEAEEENRTQTHQTNKKHTQNKQPQRDQNNFSENTSELDMVQNSLYPPY